MTDEKWRSPTGHSISSHVTDNSDFLTRGQLTKTPENVTCGDVSNVGDIQAALDDLLVLRSFADKHISMGHSFENRDDPKQRVSDLYERIKFSLTASQHQPDVAELLEALKEIENLCGTVNLSSHNQMREAVEGSIEIAATAIARAEKKGSV